MVMTTITKVIIVVVVVAASFAAGRFLTPVKTVTETKIVEVEKVVLHTETVTVTVTKPDGTVTSTTETVSDSKTHTTTDATDISTTVKTTSRLNISALAGAGVSNPTGTPTYGVHVSKDIWGPVSVGAWGISNGTAGVSIGLTF